MSVRLFQLAWESSTPYLARYVLVALADAADGNGRCWFKLPTLIKKTGMPKRTLLRQLNSLEADGYIIRIRSVHRVDYVVQLPLNSAGASGAGEARPECQTGTADHIEQSAVAPHSTVPERHTHGAAPAHPSNNDQSAPQAPRGAGAALSKKRTQKNPNRSLTDSSSPSAEMLFKIDSVPADSPPLDDTAEDVVAYWNAKAALPKVRQLTLERRKSIRSRQKDDSWRVHWRDAVDKLAASDFATGQNDRGWRADFDFLLSPSKFTKILEGKYDNRADSRPDTAAQSEAPKQKFQFRKA